MVYLCNPKLKSVNILYYKIIIILTSCPAFRGTVPIFGPKFAAVPFFSLSVPLFRCFLGTNLSLNLIIFSYIYQICKNVPLLDQKSRFFRKFVPLFASCRLVGMLYGDSFTDHYFCNCIWGPTAKFNISRYMVFLELVDNLS